MQWFIFCLNLFALRIVGILKKCYKTVYYYADIDKNGYDELILRYVASGVTSYTGQDSGYGESTNIYTIKSGKVKTIINSAKNWNPSRHSNFVRVFKKSKYIDRGYLCGYEDLRLYKFSKGKLASKAAYKFIADQGVYKINGKKVSKSKYNKKIDSLTNKYNKGYKMKTY